MQEKSHLNTFFIDIEIANEEQEVESLNCSYCHSIGKDIVLIAPSSVLHARYSKESSSSDRPSLPFAPGNRHLL